MLSLVSLFAAALVALQCCHTATALIDTKNLLDNALQPNEIPTPKRKSLHKFVTFFVAPPERARLVPGSHLELPCEVMGHPTPTVQWLKNGEPIVDYEESANEILSVHPSSITSIKSTLVVTAASTGDVYSCVASLGPIERMASTTVFVEEADDEIRALQALFGRAISPIITYSYIEVFQNIGTSIILPCRVFSYGPTQLTWTFGDQEISHASPNFRVLPSGDLLITALSFKENMGNYSCTARNMYGENTTTTFVYPLVQD